MLARLAAGQPDIWMSWIYAGAQARVEGSERSLTCQAGRD